MQSIICSTHSAHLTSVRTEGREGETVAHMQIMT